MLGVNTNMHTGILSASCHSVSSNPSVAPLLVFLLFRATCPSLR